MQRLSAPEIIRTEGLSDDDPAGLRIIRADVPPAWLLGELLFHTIQLCADAYGDVSARMLLEVALSAPRGADLRAAVEEETPFKETYTISYHRNEDMLDEFHDSASEEEKAAWDTPGMDGVDAYLQRRDEALPRYQVLLDGGNFFIGEYRHLPDDLRAVTELALSGLVYTALTEPTFGAVCRNKTLDPAALTIEQRFDEALDPDALYRVALTRLARD